LPEFRGGVVLPGADFSGNGTDGRVDLDQEPDAVAGHGTGMAALIAAQGSGTGFLGVAPRAKILPVTVNAAGTDIVAAESDGIRWAVDHSAKVINISQASPSTCVPAVQEAVGYAIEHDVVVVAGAGNFADETNYSSMPANCAGVVAVGAVGVDGDTFAPWSKTEQQPYVVVGAPGQDVAGVIRDGTVHNASGTSASSALTSGVVALVRAEFPDMPAREVVQRLIGSCLDVTPEGKDDQTGYGIIRPNRMLTGELAKRPNPVFDAYDAWKAGAAASANATPAPAAEPASAGEERILLAVAGVVGALVIVFLLAVVVRRGRRRSIAQGVSIER
jgi:hypothetical protein